MREVQTRITHHALFWKEIMADEKYNVTVPTIDHWRAMVKCQAA